MIKHCTETSYPNELCVEQITVTYAQPQDNYSPEYQSDQKITIKTEPGGYFVIETDRWAFDEVDEIIEIINDFKSKLEFAEDCKVDSDN